MGAADHRALPRRAPGRRAGGLPARPGAAGGRARARARAAAAGARAAGPRPRPGAPARAPAAGREPAVARGRAGRPRRRDRRAVRPARRPSGSSRSSAPAGSARPPLAIATGRALGGRPGRRVARAPRDGADGRRRPRHRDRGDGGDRRRGGAARAAPARRERADPRQLRARPRRGRGARRAPARRRAGAADPGDEPGPRSTSTARPSFELAPLALEDAVELFTRRAARPGDDAATCTSCAGRSTGCRWRSSSPRRARGRCRSWRSPAGSTTASPC